MAEITKFDTDGEPLRVLIADDDPIARSLIVSRLSSLNCVAEEAEDGVIGWNAIMSKSFDLAIIDLEMPNLDGIALIQCARNHPRTKHMPLVVITSRQDNAAIEDSLAAGATSFLTKPINWSTFSSHIGFLLQLTHSAHEARKATQCCEATSSIKDAVIDNVLGNTAASASNILAEVTALLDISSQGDGSSKAVEALRRIARYGQDLQQLVAKASSVAKALPETISANDCDAVVDQIFKRIHSAVATTAAARDVGLIYRMPPEAPGLRCDQNAVADALTQLVSNAIRHSENGQAVEISCNLDPNGMLVFEVSDKGDGMTPESLAKAMTPLEFREPHPPGTRKQFGLGIPLAKAIAEAHGGSFELRSNLGQGTTATFIIPPERVIVSDVNAA